MTTSSSVAAAAPAGSQQSDFARVLAVGFHHRKLFVPDSQTAAALASPARAAGYRADRTVYMATAGRLIGRRPPAGPARSTAPPSAPSSGRRSPTNPG
jgi:hypothetical protein